MSWIRNSPATPRRQLLALAAMTVAASAVPVQAATIVVRSNGPSASAYPPGKSLAPGAAIVLKAGDVVTILDAGGTRVLRGPGKLPVAGAAQANVNGIAALIADTGARQSRTGATRGTSLAPPHPINVWYVDIARGGNFCLGDVKALALWRADSSAAASLSVAAIGGGGAHAEVDFRPGQAVAAWPIATLPVSDGSQFRISGAAPGVTITTRLLPSSPDSLDATAQALLDHGCIAQVDTLVTATVDPGT